MERAVPETIEEHLDANSTLRGSFFDALLAIDDRYSKETELFVQFLKSRNLGLTFEGLRAYYNYLQEEHAGKRYKAATINWKINAAKNRIRYVFEKSGESLYPFRRYQLEKALKEIKLLRINSGAIGKNQVLTGEEIQRLITECQDRTISLMTEFLFTTGVRISEMLGVLLSDLKRINDHYEIRILGKGKKERAVFAGIDLIMRVQEHFQGTKWLFEHSGTPYSRISVTNRIRLQGTLILGREISAHTLRHSFATEKLQQTGNLKAVSKYLGHASTSTTVDLYVHSEFTWEDLQDQNNL
jgi:integrase/recombinase XerD